MQHLGVDFHLSSCGTLYVQEATGALQATSGLFVVGADIAELLAAVTLCKNCRGSVYLNLDKDMYEARHFENLRFFASFEHDKIYGKRNNLDNSVE
jgi:hypothetical protein